MPRVTPILTNFTAGEISPRLAGRVDLAKYYNGCKTLENMLVHPHGGATRRPGTYYVANVGDHNRKVRLVPFEFSVTQAYMLEFGHEYIHFYMNRGQIQEIDSYTKLLLHCDGDDASQVFTDDGNTGHTITAYGNAKLWAQIKKFGTACGAFVVPGSYIVIPDHDDWFYDTGKLTIEFWHYPFYYPDATYPDWGFWHQSINSGGNAAGFYMTWHYNAGDGKCYLRVYTPAGKILEGEYDIPGLSPDERLKWRHIVLIRGWGDGDDDWALTVDGAPIDTAIDEAGAISDIANDLEIGRCRKTSDAANYWNCGQFFDEFRISKGIARETADFRPPSVEYPLGQNSAYEVTTPYLESELPSLKFAQSADVLYITHPDHAPRKLSRTGHTAWTLTEIDFIDGPYEDEVTAVITSSAVSHQTTLALSGNGTHYLLYDDEDVVFVVGQLLTGTTSTATAKIMAITDWGTEGILTLAAISGTFQNNEDITDSGTGDATVNGTIADEYIEYDTEADGPFEVGETITGGTSGATGTLRGLQDDGADGKMVIEMTTGSVNFAEGETVTGGTSEATAKVTAGAKVHGPLFNSGDVGAPFGYYFDTTWTWLEIKSVIDDVTAIAIVRGTQIGAGPANASKYRKGSWNATNGYPHCATFHEQRLDFAAINNRPQTIWGSKGGDYEIFTPGVESVDPFIYTIASDKVNVIRWLKSSGVLVPGTIGGEWTARGTGMDEPITPTNIWIKPATTYGSANVSPIKIGQALIFLQRQGRKLREFVLSPDSVEPVYVAPDMTILAEHITKGGIIYMDYQQEPDSIVWAVRSDGVLLGMTYQRPQEVVAWHRHITDGYFESVATIPFEGQDQVWVSVRRTIGGETKRFIEYFTPAEWDEVTDSIFVDSALTYEGAEVTTLSGLDHLIGEEVSILTNKGVHPAQTVSAEGEISLDWGVTKAHVGLGFSSVLQTMGLETGQREGTAQGKIKRVHKATVRLHETLGCEVGPSLDNMDTIPFRKAGDPMDQLPPLFTGDKDVVFPGGYTKDAYVFVRQQQPLPLTVLAIIPHMATHDE